MKLIAIAENDRIFDIERIYDKDLIADIQFNLSRIGYPVTIDGIIGVQTLTAFAKFKKDNWLSDPTSLGESSAALLLEIPDVKKDLFQPTKGVGRVTSPFGLRGSPPRQHKGIDIGASQGTPIFAIADGIISHLVRECRDGNFTCGGGYGNCVYLDHEGQKFNQSRYAHLDRLASGLAVGQKITAGQQIGFMGNTGHSFGSHLHFEIRIQGVAKNPLYYLNPIV